MNKVLEIAVYELKEGISQADFEAARSKMIGAVSNYPGLISVMTFRDSEKQSIILDYCSWESVEQAKTAAETFETDPNTADFIKLIGRDIHFGHYCPEDEKILNATDFSNESVLEFAVAEVKKESLSKMKALKPKLFELVRQQKGLSKIAGAYSIESETTIIDGLCWNSKRELTNAMEVIHKEELCQKFMETFKDDIYFGKLKLVFH